MMFQHGRLTASQETAAELANRYRASSPNWSARFRIIEAQSASWRGMSQEVLQILSAELPESTDIDVRIQRLSLLAWANSRLHRYDDAKLYLARADKLCDPMSSSACSHVLAAHWTIEQERGQYDEAFRFSMRDLAMAREFNKPFEEAAALMNLAASSLEEERFEEAIDWLNASNRVAAPLQAEDILLENTGNLGWAYYSLGDREKALTLYQDAERRAVAMGDTEAMMNWLTTSGDVFRDEGDWYRARDSYRKALQLARNGNVTEEVVNSLEYLAYVSIDAGGLNDADGYLLQLDPLIRANRNRLDALDVMLARGRIAAARRQDSEAEGLFRQVEADPASQITMRLGAEHEMALLFEAEGRVEDARREYVTALGTFESERAEIRNEDSKLPFLANATPIYDDYIRLLVSQGTSEEALAAADQSRGRTLEQGLGIDTGKASLQGAGLHAGRLGSGPLRPDAIAARAGATLLFYWLGEKQSWLWAITPPKTVVFPLPAKAEIARVVERYKQELLGPEDPARTGNEDGRALYRMLVAPAKELIVPGGRVVVLCDGVLSELNFETLLVDTPAPHYWIEDADVVSAPSLLMLSGTHVSESRPIRRAPRFARSLLKAGSGALAEDKGASAPGARLLLVGDAVSPGPDYPELPNAPVEMREIEKHFRPREATVLARGQANAAAYLGSEPGRFSYIDFVAHGVASRTDPLDSAIILSRTPHSSQTPAAEDSFKLYAREIMQHPIDAQLVTIAACYGGGTRSYAGEGLVGLSWAFLRAGAHNVIGALWEVSDESAPRLMDGLYGGLQEGLPPDAALRQAKLKLLHGAGTDGGKFRRPFFWGSFQLYTAGNRGQGNRE